MLWPVALGAVIVMLLVLLGRQMVRLGAEARAVTVAARRFDRVAVAVDDLTRESRRTFDRPVSSERPALPEG